MPLSWRKNDGSSTLSAPCDEPIAAKYDGHAGAVLVRDEREQGRQALRRGDLVQLEPQRRRAFRLDRILVRAGRVEVAELLIARARRGVRCGGLLEATAQHLEVALVELV